MKVIRKVNEFRVSNDSEHRIDYVIKNLEQLLELEDILYFCEKENIDIKIENKSGYYSNVYFDLSSYDNGVVITISERDENVTNLVQLKEVLAEYIERKKFAIENLSNIDKIVVSEEKIHPYILNLLNKKFNVIFE